MQTRHWVFTTNNWTAEDERLLEALAPICTYIVWGYETGASGTPHLQGYVCFERVRRFNEAKHLLPPRTHIEPKRGSPVEAAAYCKKDGVFKEFGVAPTGSRGVGSFDRYSEWVLLYHNENGRVPSDREIAREFPSLWLRYSRKLRDLALHLSPPPNLQDDAPLRPWQQGLYDCLMEQPPDDRAIVFYVDPEGGKGKTWFQRYFVSRYPDRTQILSVGKRDDIAHAIDQTKNVFLFNVPRGGMEYFQYTVVEQLKDRMVFSPKYDSTTKILDENPHVIVFCNEPPDLNKMTEDRYAIVNIETLI